MFAPSKRSSALRERWGVSDARPAVIYAGAVSNDRGARRLLSVVMERGSARERVTDTTARVCRSHADFMVETAALVRTDARRTTMGLAARKYAKQQDWAAGLTTVYAEYRSAAETSRVRRNLEPALIPQGRCF